MSKELDDINGRLEVIERKLQSLSDQKRELTRQLRELRMRAIELIHGVKVGSIVVSKGVDHRVTVVDTRWGVDRPWLEGNPRRKDGTFGSSKRALYGHWTLNEQAR